MAEMKVWRLIPYRFAQSAKPPIASLPRRILLAALALLSLSFPAPASAAHKILLLGDSLMAGYGLPQDQGFVAQLQQALDQQGLDVELLNASVSGDTSEMALARLDWVLADKPDAVIVTLGGNDMLQGLPPERTRANLVAILERLKQDHIPVLLGGMLANRALGPDYVQAFDTIYKDLAEQYGALLIPFFLEGVALDPSLNQPDGIHPNAKGVQVIVRNILPYIVRLIESAG